METKELWKKINPSVCQIIHKKNKKTISAGTGFKCGNYIITNSHVYNPTKSDEIIIQFKTENGRGISLEKKYTSEAFKLIFKVGMSQDEWDYAILYDSHFSEIPNLKLSDEKKEIEIGQKCIFLGFPFNSNYLTIHEAIISAKYTNKKNNVKYILLDASVNQGNSGGPLIEIDSQEVVGIITLKKTGLSEKFTKLENSFKYNIKLLENKSKEIEFFGIDPINVFRVIQDQFSALGNEIKRSSNVGIGFGFELDKVREELKNLI